MKILAIAFLWIAATIGYGQTTVSGTVIDTDSIAWVGGTVTANFYPTPAFPGTSGPANVVSAITSGGNYSLSLPLPSGASWSFVLCPKASAACVSQIIVVSGSSQTANFTPLGIRFPAIALAYGYSDVEISPANPPIGSSYFNVTSNVIRTWSGSSWISSGGAGSAAYSAITSGTNLGQGLVNGNGTVFTYAGTGIVNSNEVTGAVISNTPTAGLCLTATGVNAAAWGACGTTVPGSSRATVMIAASNSINKAFADVQCTGTNDQTCINNAEATYCPSGQAGTVPGCDLVLMYGTYNTPNSIIINRPQVTLEGQARNGYGTGLHTSSGSVQLTGTGAADVVQINPANACTDAQGFGTTCESDTVQNVTIVCNASNVSTTNGVNVANADLALVADTNIFNCGTGITGGADTAEFRSNSLQEDTVGIHISGLHTSVHDNILYSLGGACITGGTEDLSIHDNRCGFSTGGILVQFNGGTISGNVFNAVSGVVIESISGSYGVSITGNTINNIFSWIPSTFGNQIDLSDCRFCSASSNTINTSGTLSIYAISASSATSTSVADNSETGTWNNGPYNFGTLAAQTTAGNSIGYNVGYTAATFTVAGCGTATSVLGKTDPVSGTVSGSFVGGSATCTPVITTNLTTTNGYACSMSDFTTSTALFRQTASSTTTATFTAGGVVGATDSISFSCQAN